MKIYWRHAVLTLCVMEERGRAFFEIAPAIGGKVGGIKAGNDYYDYTEAIRLAFDPLNMLKASYNLTKKLLRLGLLNE